MLSSPLPIAPRHSTAPSRRHVVTPVVARQPPEFFRIPQDVEEIVCAHSAIHDGRAVALGIFNPALGTQDLAVVAQVQQQELLENRTQIEREIRAAILAGLGVVVGFLFLKPPKWIVKSTAGKPARSTTHEKLLQE